MFEYAGDDDNDELIEMTNILNIFQKCYIYCFVYTIIVLLQ